jgi:putative molybdopterin biosynthesis protein
MHEFLTTKEVADLLRIKERKLYDLCAEGVLPVTKVTGKLIFPRAALMAWLRANTDYGAAMPALRAHPPVVAGSQDPLLDWALRASGSDLATLYDGSGDGLARIARGQAVAVGVHFHDVGTGTGSNVARLRESLAHEPVILVEWARRTQGLIVKPQLADEVRTIADIAGRRVVMRQPGAGSQTLFTALLDGAGIGTGAFTTLPDVARRESDLAQTIAQGDADLGFGIEAVARQHHLPFVALWQERFDLIIWRRDYCEPPLQRLFAFARTPVFADHARQLGGYDIAGLGTIHFNGL